MANDAKALEQARKALNEECRFDPKVGDIWEERLVLVCIVLEVDDRRMVVCRKKKDIDSRTWEWDLEKAQVMTRSEFETWVAYGSIPGCWCSGHRASEKSLSEVAAWVSLGSPRTDPGSNTKAAKKVEDKKAVEVAGEVALNCNNAIALATHQHYKGGYYRVVGEATHTETQERLVVYEHVWPHEKKLWTRPYDMFYGNLENGEPRFRLLTKA